MTSAHLRRKEYGAAGTMEGEEKKNEEEKREREETGTRVDPIPGHSLCSYCNAEGGCAEERGKKKRKKRKEETIGRITIIAASSPTAPAPVKPRTAYGEKKKREKKSQELVCLAYPFLRHFRAAGREMKGGKRGEKWNIGDTEAEIRRPGGWRMLLAIGIRCQEG